MKNTLKKRLFAFVLCLALILTCLPLSAFAESADASLLLTAGDVQKEFVPAGTACKSSDPSVAWVDEAGTLNALRSGTAVITVPYEEGHTEYTVTVSDYSDGSEIVGNLKILARYNDSMQFYDGHVYLLFTSYQDGVEITVPDLYAGYEISDAYYDDIRKDISNGSNHTGNDTDKYFTFNDQMTSVTLDRGEIVTIGMYRDFDLSVPQAALGSVQNSSMWEELSSTAKAEIISVLFKFLDSGSASAEESIAKLKAICEEAGQDYTKLLDGVVGGGVCFNRELYNQKLEWDQYENIDYEMDITGNQLKMMSLYLGGNLNKFSILKNSCATVALRAWNAAVGTRGGEPGAYYLTSAGDGILSMIDAPKGVRDSIVSRLPGYYLNNAEGVAEPDAGFEDETGCVYVSAPEAVTPLTFVYDDGALFFDESKTKVSTLINSAKAGSYVSYNKDEQDVDVVFNKSTEDGVTTVNGVEFHINGTVVTLNADNMPEGDVWYKVWIGEPDNDEEFYVTDAQGKVLPSESEDGFISFCSDSLPFSYRIVGSSEGTKNILRTISVNGDKAKALTEVYRMSGEDKLPLNSIEEVAAGTTIYIKPALADDEYDYVISDITLNGVSVFSAESFDQKEGAYAVEMPERFSTLKLVYDQAVLLNKDRNILQISVGDTLDAADYAQLTVGSTESDRICWRIISDPDSTLTFDGKLLKAAKEGEAVIWACAEDNENIGLPYSVRIYENTADMAAITYDESTAGTTTMSAKFGEEDAQEIPYSGYLVKKGSDLTVTPLPESGQAVFTLQANDRTIWPGEAFNITEDTQIKIKCFDAVVSGMPETIRLSAKGDTYQLSAKAEYTGLLKLIPIYDSSITYISSDDLIAVDENGVITVAGDVPEEGALVYVTAYAGSAANNVCAATKVIIGDYRGTDIVGKLTIYSRRIDNGELVPHGSVTFTTYEDLDLDVSYYHYYRPDDRYNDYMIDYEKHPEAYTSDPALYSENELGLEDRESYFETFSHGALSDPSSVSLVAGESITLSNYGYDSTNIIAIRRALEGSTISSSREAAELIRQMKLYSDGEEIDGAATFDSLVATLMQIYVISTQTGVNPADGHSEGGMDINRELFNQFRRNDSQLPNNFYTAEITADELAKMKQYLSDPQNNYYSFMTKNCATGSVDIWNTTLFDRPELQLTGNLTGIAVDPQSLYFEIGALTSKDCVCDLYGFGGTDFYPRTVRYSDDVSDVIEKIKAIGEVALTDECKNKIEAAREAYDALSDAGKARVWNYPDLVDAEKAYNDLITTGDQAVFEAYKGAVIAAIESLREEDDPLAKTVILNLAEAAVSAVSYDEAKTLPENIADVDEIVEMFRDLLEAFSDKEEIILGDADGDGKVTILDVTCIQKKLASVPVESFNERAADADEDGKVTVLDATYIQKWLASMPVNDNIGKPITK
ncbi:MAG: dockerin type I repeat-containing protein [Ruminococcus sp.]|nr:dockerin type I repeat-containing protein [Ruminococcus sp.]